MLSIILNEILPVVADFGSIVSFVLALSANKINRDGTSNGTEMHPKKWPFIVILLATIVSFFLLFYNYISPDNHNNWGEIFTFVVPFILLIVYAIKAYQSFNKINILPPKLLWQILFNKIPNNEINLEQSRDKLSRYSHVVFLSVLGLALVLFISFAVAEKKMRSQSVIFGADRSKFYQNNKISELWENPMDIESLRIDDNFKKFMDGHAKYSFGEIEKYIDNIKLWLRNDKNDSLVCIYAYTGLVKNNDSKNGESMIGGIANHASIFVLWPGYNNNDPIWKDENKNTMAWSNEDNGEYYLCELRTDNQNHNIELRLIEKKNTDPFILRWDPKNTNNSKDITLYGFSYEGRLAVEIDFRNNALRDKSIRFYIQNLQFRNSVRKFTACVNSFLNYYYLEKTQPKIDSIKNANNAANTKH